MARRLKTPADPRVLPQFREVLRRADFTVPAITALLGNAEITELKSRSPRLLHATRSGTPLDTLIRLFVAGTSVPLEQAEAALQPVPVSTLCQAGVLRMSSGSAVSRTASDSPVSRMPSGSAAPRKAPGSAAPHKASGSAAPRIPGSAAPYKASGSAAPSKESGWAVPLISILPHDDLVLASDQPFRSGKAADYVPGMLDSSVFLELFTIRRPLRSALDLGTGCGVHALRAALHSEQVVAADFSPRALDFARFNAALNGASNIEFLQGNGFEPVAGRCFDLIVSNLPFAVTPSARYVYRDSGMRLDDFTHRIVAEAPGYMSDGGYCQLLCQWVEIEGQDWHHRLQEWFEGSGCDVWVMKSDSRSPDAYAEKWIADTEPCPPEGVERLFEQWMEFYERERIVAIHGGAIAMRRRAGNNWIRMDEGPDRARSPFGDAVLRAFAVGDYLQGASDPDLLEQHLRLSPDVHLIQRCDWSNGEWHADACQIRFHRELEYIANIDRHVSQLVARCTGERRLRELIDELAAQIGIPPERLSPACVQLVRGLMERGFLLPDF